LSEPCRRPESQQLPSEVDWNRFVQLIHGHQRFLLTTHIRPDCDAVGSVMGMAGILERLGKTVQIVTGFDLPPNLRFLDPERRIKRLGTDVAIESLESIEVLLVLDTSAWAQLGDMGELIRATKAKKAVLDHHVSSDDLGAELFKDTTAEATGRLVAEAAEHLNVALASDIARPLFAALTTDTGWFRFASTTSETLRLGARLMDAGAVPDELYKQLYENESLGRLRLIGHTLARLQTELGGRLIYSWISLDDFRAAGALPSDSEDIINMSLGVGGTEFALIFVEQPSGGFKISFRSRCDVDCSRIAEQFGGGGHRRAAGAFLRGSLDEVLAKTLDVVRRAMQ
jgi:phosphoesterase RecJ-like protein